MADVSGKLVSGVEVRVYFSGEGTETHRHNVALSLEGALGMKGSSVQAQEGRWDGQVEPGYVVTLTCDRGYSTRQVAALVKQYLDRYTPNLSFYVTVQEVSCMEVF